jgi:hypothetical protein
VAAFDILAGIGQGGERISFLEKVDFMPICRGAYRVSGLTPLWPFDQTHSIVEEFILRPETSGAAITRER